MRSHHQPGDIIADKYQIVGILGEGNSGVTYRAIDLTSQQQIALKAMSLQNISDWKLVELFEREAKILAKLNHPNIPTYLDYFKVDTTNNRAFYIAQELATGQSLASLVESGWHKSEAEIKQIAIALLKILVYLHLQKPAVIHRDIKPQNIIRRDDGKIFLVDFGAVGHTYHNTIMRGSTIVGTYGYMAPEQFRGQAFTATDLYGLGATLLYLFTHRSPAELPTDRLRINFRSHLRVSEEFGDWLEKMLEPDLSERFPSAAAALEALQPKKISLTKSISWQTIVLTIGIGVGTFFAIKSLAQQKYAVFNKLGLTSHVHAAIYQNAIDIPDYLAQGGDVNGKDKRGKTLLHYAVENNKLDLIKYLLDKGADINQVDLNGNTALYKAVDARHIQLISLLKNNNARLNNKDLERLGLSLHKNLCNLEKVSFLLSYGANPNTKDKSGLTPLLKVVSAKCEKNHWDESRIQKSVAQQLIDAGGDVNIQNSQGQTPLHLIDTSSSQQNTALAQLLINTGAYTNIQDNNGQTPLHVYVGTEKNFHYDLIKTIVKAGASVNARDNNGKTPLHIAGENSNSYSSYFESFLYKSGANLYIADRAGLLPAYTHKQQMWQQEEDRKKLARELAIQSKYNELNRRRERREREWRKEQERRRRRLLRESNKRNR